MTTHLHDVLIRKAFWTAIFIVVLAGVPALAADARQPDEGLATSDARSTDVDHDGHDETPHWATVIPFVVLLLCIAILPLFHKTMHWWEDNRNRLLISLLLSVPVMIFYFSFLPYHGHKPGGGALHWMLRHATLGEYIPFIVLLFSLYVISGGIVLRGDLQARPITNTAFMGIGALLASFIGTTGAAMLLIRPVLHTNAERRNVKHTVIFFILLVCNCGGCLLPIGDPPLFLGYLRGVPFWWTMSLWPQWLFVNLILLVIYFIWDTISYRKEKPRDIKRDETQIRKLQLVGKVNLLFLVGVVIVVAVSVPGKPFPFTNTAVPEFMREVAMIILVVLSLRFTPKGLRKENNFNYGAIAEVAALFIGIFITMQPALQILGSSGAEIGLSQPWHFFWATGTLSSFLDNAPTYVVFFETAGTLRPEGMPLMNNVATTLGTIPIPLLTAISLAAVFMGTMSYIGNGPNFMVKSIAEQSGIKMPSFFGYMVYSVLIMLPILIVLTFVFPI